MRLPPTTGALHRLLPAAALGALLLAAGCASEPAPREQLAVSRAAVERVSGPAAAEAADDVANARDKLARANAALAKKDFPLARQLAEQAEADAALADAKARSERSSEALGEVRKSLQMLRAELAKS
jgi:hypothetical protein